MLLSISREILSTNLFIVSWCIEDYLIIVAIVPCQMLGKIVLLSCRVFPVQARSGYGLVIVVARPYYANNAIGFFVV